jgi:carbon monoxide dehydrogenase subunit G
MADKNVALFPACFQVSRESAGSETATFKWLVNAVHKTISGTGHLTQAINPPTNVTVEMTGSYVEVDGRILVHAAGALFGASIQVVLELDSWSGSGKALSLKWLANNHYFAEDNVPAESINCFG